MYKARKKGNARAHRARTKGSVKARGKEFVTTAPRRSRQIAGGAAVYAVGRYSGSARAQQIGYNTVRRGVSSSVGRTTATYHMSKGLKKSRNRQAKDQYYRDIGTSRNRRNAMKLAGAAVAVGAVAYGVKSGNISGSASNGLLELSAHSKKRGAFVSARIDARSKGSVKMNAASRVRKGSIPRSRSAVLDVSRPVSFSDRAKSKARQKGFVI